jgi:hypothetical protein
LSTVISKGKKVWLDADIFAKHNITILKKFFYLLGDARGPKSTFCLAVTDLQKLPASLHLAFTFSSYLHAPPYGLESVLFILHSLHIRPTLQLWPLGLPISSQE